MLTSWKEIAAFFDVDITTVQRWERERQLPIHRHSHRVRSSVYAFPQELESWRAAQHGASLECSAKPRSNAVRNAVFLACAAAVAVGIGVALRSARAIGPEPPVDVAVVGGARPVAVTSLDDVDGDGRDDLVVHPVNGSEFLIYLGSLDARPSRPPDVRITSDRPQVTGGSVGDVDGDGIADLVISVLVGEPETYSATGPSYLIRGRTRWPSAMRVPDDADTRFEVPSPHGDIRMGVCVTPGGVDLNADGLREIVFGGPDFSPPGLRSAGGVFVIFGRPVWPQRIDVVADAAVAIHGSRTGEGLGPACAAGDFTRDGRADLALVAVEETLWNLRGGRGRVYLLEGREAWPRLIQVSDEAILRLTGVVERATPTAPILADVNGDGAADLVVGFSHAAGSGLGGRVVTVFGARASRAVIPENKADVIVRGDPMFGRSITAADFNGDGRADVVVADAEKGHVYLFAGRDRFLPSGSLAAYAPSLLADGGRGTGLYGLVHGSNTPTGIVLEMTPGPVPGTSRVVRLTPAR